MTYADRRAAGRALATALAAYAGRPDVIVLGLVRGGVPVAAETASLLGVPMDALVIRKLGVPWAPEVAFGALGPGDVIVHNEDIVARLPTEAMDPVVRQESAELARREERYRAGRPPLALAGRVALLVDDGLATGATARAAVEVSRGLGAARVVVAVPVGSPIAVGEVGKVADDVICPLQPDDFGAVSRWYDRFPQVTDAEVARLLA